MVTFGAVADRNHAAVAASQAASHHALDRHFRRPAISSRNMPDGFEHWFGTAGVDHDVWSRHGGLQLALEGDRDAAAIAGGAILGRQHQPHAAVAKPVQIKEIPDASS